MEIESDIDLYDTDRLALNKVVVALRENVVGRRMSSAALRNQITERFHEVGFLVDARIWVDEDQTEKDGYETYFTKVVITGRVEPEKEFDHERMGHEVRSNVLGLPGQEKVQPTQVAPGFASTKSGLIVPN